MARRPTLADTSDWEVAYESTIVKMERATLTIDGRDMKQGAYRVTVLEHESYQQRGPDGGPTLVPKQSKLFYGESAWSDAERMASDVDRGAIGRA